MILENLRCSIIPVILNLQIFKRESYISVICQASTKQRKAEKQMRTPTWLRLGVKIQEPAFWGIRKMSGSCAERLPSFVNRRMDGGIFFLVCSYVLQTDKGQGAAI